ncbi:MAG TPA: hypothetical protein VF591_26050 [Pyrinomonadaceae bacterium]|jgi:hypothetical protein
MRNKALAASLLLTALVYTCLAQAGRAQKNSGPATRPATPAEKPERKSALRKSLQSLLPDVTVTDESVRDAARPRKDESYTMLRIVWTADDPAAPAKTEVFGSDHRPGPPFAGRSMRVTGRRTMKGGLARQRGVALSSEDVLMVALDAAGRLRCWYAFADPRLSGEEGLPLPGESEGRPRRTFHLSRVKFYVGVPDDPEIAEVRFYHPRWTGDGHVLEALGTIHF